MTTIPSTSDSPLFYMDDKIGEGRSFVENDFDQKEFSFEILVERSLTI